MNIITLGDIFKNLETDEKAFGFLKYIKELQKQKEVLDKIKEYCKNTINRYEDYIGKEDIVRENKFILELLEEIE